MLTEFTQWKPLSFPKFILLFLVFLASSFFATKTNAQCPEIQVVELLGVPGFSETDEIVVCGKPDTLAYLIYIEEPGEISGTQMTVDFLPGIIYAGFELTHYDSNTFISVVNPSPEKPRFLLDGVTEGIYIAYIGTTADCSVDKNALEYRVDLKFNFTYQDTLGNFFNCSQEVTPDRTYNTTIKTPALNWQSTPNMNINRIGIERCFNVRLTQDGIDAYLEDFYLELQNIDLSGSLNLNRVLVNNSPITYDYDNTNRIIRTEIDGSFFSGNAFANPADTLFNTGERIQITYCWQSDECPSPSSFPLKYVAGWGCYGETCDEIERDRTLSIRPTARPEPIAIDTVYSTPEVCGDPGTIGLTIYSDQSNPFSGRFTDMKIGFETCNKPSLEITEIRVGGMTIGLSVYTWVNDDLVIDFTNLSVDADGAEGLSDVDGDGFFDDLVGGDTLKVEIDMAYSCTTPPDPGSIACGVINCDFAQFFVDANRDCGQAFKFYPPIDGFEIVDGATSSRTNATEVSSSFTGIDFGSTGTSGAKTRTVEMCYVHEQRGVTPCASGNSNVALQVFFDGNGGITHDLEVDDPSSIEISVNGTPTITGVPITWDSIGPGQRMLTIDAGLVSIGDEICYRYELTVDTFLCAPNIYTTGTHQVVETCTQGGCTCEAVKACESILFRSNPNNTGCTCVFRSGVSDIYRESVGYTDATMTTKLDPQTITGADRNRYLPGDTIMYEAYYSILSPDAFTDIYEWGMGMRIIPFSGDNAAVTELQMDARKTELMSFSVKKVGSTTRTEIDFSDLPACVEDGSTTTSVNGVTLFMGSTPYDNYIDNHFQTYNNTNLGYDFYDNSRIYIQIRNQNTLQDCRGVDFSGWNDLGNCWDEFNAKYGFQVGDSLFMRVRLPLIKNPMHAAEGGAFQATRIYQDTWASAIDEFDSDCIVGQGICRENFPLEFYCPGDISVRTDLEIDDCGGQAKHIFTVDNPTPLSWYANEYRPYFRMKDTDIEVYSPLMYCGNAEINTPGGLTYPLEIQNTENHDCVVVNGEEYCTVSDASPGTITFNPLTDNYPGLGVGLGGFRDSMTITYDYCLVCPADITGLNDYKITYDYQYPYDPPSEPRDYRCNFNGTTLAGNELDSCFTIGNGQSYYDYFDQDMLVLRDDNESSDATVTDNRQGFPSLTPAIDRSVITSQVPGTSEEINEYTVCAGSTPSLTQTGVITTVKVNNSVQLVNIYDETLTPLTYQYVSTDGNSNTYIINLPDLAPDECHIINVGTRLLFCPEPPQLPAEICIGTSSGCMDPAIQAAVLGSTTACNTNNICYRYTVGAPEIQSTFIEPQGSFDLCDTITMFVLVKNVKDVLVTDLQLFWELPLVGTELVQGSFESAYPHNGVSGAPFVSIPDPDINGNMVSYTEDADFNASIHSNGFPGVNAGLDSNQIVVRFKVLSVCDEFISGSTTFFEAVANDPCSPNTISSGEVNSERIIINGAEPINHAQILTSAKPTNVYCGGLTNEFTITGQNISEVASGDYVQICLTFPPDLPYRSGTLAYAIPSGQSTGPVIETMIGDQTQICFDGVPNLPVGGQFTLKLEASMAKLAGCGDVDLIVDIKDRVEDETCVRDGSICDVWVQSSVNNRFSVDLKAPLETADLQITRQCTGTDNPVTICYDATFINPGPNYNGDITVELFDDLLANGFLDYYDPFLAADTFPAQFIASMDTLILSGCFVVEEINACPILIKSTYDTACECDTEVTPFFAISPAFVAEIPTTNTLCPGEEIGVAFCGDYEFSFDDTEGYMRIVGDSAYFGVQDGVMDAVSFTVTGSTGECVSTDVFSIRRLAVPFPLNIQDTMACTDQPKYLQLEFPPEFEDDAVITWKPSTYLSDPTISDPIFTAPAPGNYGYRVNLDFGTSCGVTDSITMVVDPIDPLTITGEDIFCRGYQPATISTNVGFNNYEWYKIGGTFEIIQAVTGMNNLWTGPFSPGEYLAKGYLADPEACPSVSPLWTVVDEECLDIEVTKIICDIPAIPELGDTVTYCIEICNINSVNDGLIYLADDLVVEDTWPDGVTFLGYTATKGIYIPTMPNGTWAIPEMNSGDCETLEIMGRIDRDGIIENLVQLNQVDKTDIDSAPDNEDGDQSEDEEALASFSVILASIGDQVWIDSNMDGIFNSGEIGMANVQVILYNIDGTPRDTTYTNGSGIYEFISIPTGDYYLEFDQTTTTTPGAEDYPFTLVAQGDGTNDSETNAAGLTPTFSFDATTGNDLTHDAGLIPVADIGNFVWVDTDGDGIQDPAEAGITNATVILYDDMDNPLDTAFTDVNGEYLFENIPAGDYSILIDPATSPGGQDYVFTDANTGDRTNDSDADATGTIPLFTFDPLIGDELTLDAGLIPVANIGNFVWVDNDMDGIQDPGEPGLENVLAVLYAADGTPLDSVFTDANGMYLFEDITVGYYYVGFEPNADPSNMNYGFTATNMGNGSNDSDADTNGFTNVFSFDPQNGDELAIDAGVSAGAGIGNFVWIDTDGDGVQDASETGISGVNVNLYDDLGNLIATTVTDGNGMYLFENIPSGDYYVEFDGSTSDLGGDYDFTGANTSGDAATDSDAGINGQTAIFSFDAAAGSDLTIDAGLLPRPEISTVKAISNTSTLGSGNIDITFELAVKNTGVIDLTNLSLTDDLMTQLGTAFVGMSAASPNLDIISSTAAVTPALNTTFNGMGNNDVFAGSATDLLQPSEEIKLILIAEIDPRVASFPLENQTQAAGEGLDLNGNPLTRGGLPVSAADDSDSGYDLDGDNPGEPGDNGTRDDPTSLICTPANIDITGEPAGICAGELVGLQVTSNLSQGTYRWRYVGDNTVIVVGQNPTFTGLTTTTDVWVEITNTGSGCVYNLNDTTTINVFTNPGVSPVANYTLNSDCSPADLTLNANVSAGSAAVSSYSWSGPNGFTSNVENPVIANATEANNGSYTLVVTDANGCTDSGSIQVSDIENAQAQPVVQGTGPACEGGRITLTVATYQGANVTYNWSTPSGTNANISGVGTNQIIISPVENATHEGIYTVTIDVDGCILTASYNVIVYDNPIASAVYTSTDSCNGGEIVLEGTGSGIEPLSYQWSGPNGFTSSQKDITISNVDESYNGLYTLTVNSQEGCASTADVTVDNILSPSDPPTIATNGPIICEGEAIVLTTSATGTNFEWIGPLGASASTLMMPSLTTTTGTTTLPSTNGSYLPGDWSVRVTDANGCTSTSAVESVTIQPIPVAVASNSGPVCETQPIQLFAGDVPEGTYRWYDGDPGGAPAGTLIAMEKDPIIYNLAAGSHDFYLTVEQQRCVSPQTMTTAVINTAPATQPTATYVLGTDCAASDLTLNAGTILGSGAIATYQWIGPNNFTSNEATPVIENATTANNGSYQLTVIDENGCSATGTVQVSDIMDMPAMPQITSSGPDCEGGSLSLNVGAYTAANVDYVWSTPGNNTVGISGFNTSQLIISPLDESIHAGEYSVVITVDGCVLESDTFSLDLFATPTASLAATTGVICEGSELSFTTTASGAASYEWTGPNGFTSNTANPVIANTSINNNGTYTLVVRNTNGCSSSETILVNNIEPTPTMPAASSNGPVCEDGMINLSVQQSYAGGATYTWTNGAGATIGTTSSIAINPTDAAAISPYRVMVAEQGCPSDLSEPIEVDVIELPVATASNNGTICPGEEVQLLAGTIGGASYEWRIAGSTNVFSTDQNPTIFNLTGNETYELTVITNSCISDPLATTTVIVNTPPATVASANYTLNTDCSANDLSLTSNATAGSGTVVSFEWSGPNGFSSMVPDPIITDATGASNGSYTLVITDENGCTATSSVQVTNIMDAVAQPVISSTGPACDQASIVLKIPQYNGSNVTYNWTTPDNTNIAGLNTNQIIISPVDTSIHQGIYSVEVIVDGCTLNSNTYEVSTFESAIVMPMSMSTDSCSGGDLQLLAGVTGNGPFTYEWIGPNGFVSNLENPNITGATIANNGQYIVEVTNTNGCTSSQSVTVDHISPEAIVPGIDTDTEICAGDDIVLATSTEGDLFEWIQFSDSQGSLAEAGMTTTTPTTTVGPGHPFYQSGPWRVRVTNADGCDAESVSINVTINEIPEALAANNSPVCEGMPITLSSNTLTGGEYRWYDADPMGVPAGNLISMNATVNVENLSTGSHDFYLTITQNGCESPASITTVIIEDAPAAAPTSAYTLQADCAPADLELFANASSGSSTITYNWSGSNGFTSTLENPVIPNATEASNGSYVLTINDGNVCTTTETVEVSGIMNQQAMPLISHNGSECAGDLVEISVPQYTGAAVDYVWTTPTLQDIDGLNTNSLVISPVDGAIHNGDYSVEITIDGCVVNSDVFTLNINNQPSAAPTATAGVICSGEILSLTANGSTNVNTYQWTGPNGFSSIAENPELANVSPENNGTYTLIIQTSEGCTETQSITVNNIVPTPVMASVTTNGPVCWDEDIILNIQQTYAGTSVTYQWTNGAGTVIGTSASMSIAANSPNAISPYRMEVTVDGCMSELSNPTVVTVNELPPSIATNAGAICAGENAQLFANPVAGASYEWRLSGSADIISTQQNPVIADLTSDMTFELTVINNTCVSNPLSTTTVTVNQEPVTAPSATYVVATDCAASNLELFANAMGTGNLTYEWIGPNGFSSVAENPVIASATEAANGNYEVVITDDNGCITSGNVTVNTITNTVAQPVIASSGPACEGENITLNVASYTGTNVTYTWSTPNGTTTNITGLNTNQIVITPVDDATHTGTYMVTVEVDGCTLESQTIEVDVFDTPTAAPVATSSTICEEGDLELTANATGATSYQWSGPNGFNSTLENPNIVNVTTANNGQYTLVITSVSGCTQTESITVNNILDTPEQPTIEVASICEGEDLILATSAGGTLYEWIGPLGSSTSTLAMAGLTTTTGMTSLPLSSASYLPGDWSVRVTDANGCTSISDAEVLTIHAVPVAEAFNSGSICPGELAQLMATTNSNASYEWRDGSGTLISTEQNPMLSPAVTTTYELTVINNGCISDPVATTTIVVNEEPAVSPSTSYTLNTDCSASDLGLFANEAGTSGAIASYAWNGPNGFTSAEANPIIVNATEAANGNYTLLVTNSNGCTTSGTVTVTAITNTVAQPVISSTGPACEGEIAALSIPTYTGSNVDYIWTTPSNVNVTGENTSEITISPLDGATHEGNYTVTVTVDGCILTSDTYTIDVLTQPTASPIATATPLCEDEILSLTANGTDVVSYQWSGPNSFSSNAESPVIENITVENNGTYTLVVTSESGCTETLSVDVTNIQPTPTQPVVTTNGPVCIDDMIELSIQQQYAGTAVSYEWTNGAGVVIGTNQLLMIAASDGDAISPYRVTVTVDGCTSPLAAATEVMVNELPPAIATNAGAVCPDEVAQLFANPIAGASYQWRDLSTGAIVSTQQNPSLTPSTTTTYELTVINNGCVSNPLSTTTVVVNDEPTVNPTTSYTLNTDCSASDLGLFANEAGTSGAITSYAWSGPNGFTSAEANPIIVNATEAANGNYTLLVTNVNGCITTGTVTVNAVTNTVAQPVISSTGPACEGEVTVLSIPAYTGSSVDYVWTTPSNINITGLNTNEITVSPLDGATHEGTYTVTVTVDGCVLTSDTYTIDVLTQPTASPVATSTLLCEDDILSLTANATDAVSYQWSGPNGFSSNAENPEIENISVANNGTYTLVVTSESGCESTTSISISSIEPTPATPTITTNSPQCEDGMIVLSVQEQYTGGVINYEWTNGQGTIIGTTSTMMIAPTDVNAISPYRVMVRVDGCESPLAIPAEVEISDLLQAIATNGGAICPNETAQLFANPIAGATYEWRDAATGNIVSTVQNPTLNPQITTTYELTVINNGCVSNPLATTTVTVNDTPVTTPSSSYTVNTDCAASDLELFANITNGSGTVNSYEWSGPNDFSSADANPVLANATEAANGNYNLIITDDNGCTATGNVTVNTITNTVAQPVIASSGPACEGENITLNVASYTGTNVTYAWSTPNGTTTNITGLNTNQIVITPVDDATHTGTYMVTVVVDGCTLESQTIEVDVFDTPTAAPVATASTICENGDLALTANATGQGILSYQWSGPNGFSSSLENPNIINASPANNGQYILTVTSGTGCVITESITVTNILETPEPPTIATANICEGENIVLTTSAVGTLYEWIGPLGSSTGTLALPGLTTTTNSTSLPVGSESYLPGAWSVRVTDGNGCTSISDAVALTINEVPVAQAFNAGAICAGDVAELSSTFVSGASYKWRIAGSTAIISTLQNPMLSPTATTTYELTVINNGCISNPVATTTVTVEETPAAAPTATYSLNGDCSPSDLELFANVSVGNITSYAWSGPNGYTANVENPLIENADETSNGSYTLTITTSGGCTVSESIQVVGIVDQQAQPIITSSGPACGGETIVLSVPAYAGANVDYVWDLPSTVNVTGENTNQLIITPADATIHEGTYQVTVTVDGCILTSDTYTIDVFVTPSAAPLAATGRICEGEALSLTANALNTTDYYWTGPNGFTATSDNPVISNVNVNNNGTYTLVATSESGCTISESIIVNNIVPTPVMPTVSVEGEVCADEVITLSVQETYAGTNVNYVWTNGAGVIVGTTPVVDLNPLDGDAISPYRVMITVDGCTSPLSNPVEVEVGALPIAIANNSGFICAGEDGQLIAGTIVGASYEWRVAGSNTVISTDQTPTIFNLSSTTTYELTVISATGCISNPVATTTIEVNETPEVNPSESYTVNTDCSPADLTLFANINIGSGNIVNYAWSGPNGYTSSVENPVIENATEGNNGAYQLVVTDEFGCTTSGSIAVSGIQNSVAQPQVVSTGPACSGEQIVLSIPAYTGSSVDYQWNVPSNVNVTGTNGNQIIVSPVDANIHQGNYTVMVMVDGCTISSDIYTLDIFDQPLITPEATTDATCETGTINLLANANNAASYQWSGPNNFSSNAENPIITNVDVANNGTYTLIATSVSGCTVMASVNVEIIGSQPVQPAILTAAEVCEDEDIILNIQQTYSGTSISYTWYNGTGAVIGNTASLTIATSSVGAVSPYYVEVTVDDCTTPISEAVNVTVNELPLATATNNGPLCSGEIIQLTAGTINGGTYYWYDGNPQSAPPGTLISTNQSPFIGNLEPGIHDFYLIVENENGCGSQTFAVTQVEIFAEPVISAVSGDGTYCQGETVTLSAINTVPTGGSMSYMWTGPNGFSYTGTSAGNGPFDLILPNISPDFEGSYTLTLTTEDGCMTTAAQSVNIDLDATPITPVLTANTDLICEGEIIELASSAYTGTPVVYTWTYTDNDGNVMILGDTDNPSFFITDVDGTNTGIYSVIVTVDGCSSQPSNGELITVFGNVAPPITSNPTSAVAPACIGDNVDLSVPLIVGATYEWFGPNGFNSTLPNPVIINIDENGAGEYYVVVELNGCATVVSEPTTVFVQQRPATPTIVNNGPWCEGSDLILSVSSQLNIPPGMTVSFDWYNAATNALIGTTEDSSLTIENIDASFSGEYYVIYTLGQCSALPSEVTMVQIDAVPNNAADAGEDIELCASQVVVLDAEAPTSGTGFWTSVTGATIANPELANAEASDLNEGENIFIWTLSQGECRDYDADTMTVTVNLTPVDIAFAGNDIDQCGGNTELSLTAAIPVEATGIWSQSAGQAALGVVIVEPTNPNTEIRGMVFGNQYLFTWTLSLGTCENYSVDEIMVSVSESPEISAFVYENTVFSCGGETLNLSALEPTTGFGKWSTTSAGRIIDPFESETIVDDLPMGRSVFVWSLSVGDCENYSQDSVVIYREDEIVTQGENYELAFGDTLRNMNLLLNDLIGNVEEWELTLITEPLNGTLVGNFTTGMFEYQPVAAFFGEDQFEYEICNVNCPGECSTAIVNIKVNGQDQTGECWVPNIMTPNGDGDNDAFVIPCLDAYPDNEIRVYNRWGDLVYRKNGYANDWEGTYNGALLPSGTYFYIIRLSPEDTQEIQGYFTIFR